MHKVMKYGCMIFGAGLIVFLWAYFSVGEDTPENSSKVASFNIPGPHNRQFVLYGSNYSEIGRSYYCSLSEDGVDLFHKKYLYTDHTGEKVPFHLISTKDGNMVALAHIESPTALLIIHNFTTGAYYPYDSNGTLTYHEVYRAGGLLLDKFRKAIGDDKYTLGP